MPKKSAAPKRKKVSQSVFSYQFLHQEQLEFHRKHPNAEKLIAIFVFLSIIALLLAFYRFGWQPAQAYARLYSR